MICDAAEVSDGKLFVLGGGWNLVVANKPVNIALAIMVAVPWDRANQRFRLDVKLMTDDGEPFMTGEEGEEQEVAVNGEMEVGRPAGLKAGINLNAPIAPKFSALVLPPGGYRWEVFLDNEPVANAPFRAINGGGPEL